MPHGPHSQGHLSMYGIPGTSGGCSAVNRLAFMSPPASRQTRTPNLLTDSAHGERTSHRGVLVRGVGMQHSRTITSARRSRLTLRIHKRGDILGRAL